MGPFRAPSPVRCPALVFRMHPPAVPLVYAARTLALVTYVFNYYGSLEKLTAGTSGSGYCLWTKICLYLVFYSTPWGRHSSHLCEDSGIGVVVYSLSDFLRELNPKNRQSIASNQGQNVPLQVTAS